MGKTTFHPEGCVYLDIDLRIDTSEMREWPPQCIAEFFAGVARAQEAVSYARAFLRSAERSAREESPQSACSMPSAAQSDGSSSDEQAGASIRESLQWMTARLRGEPTCDVDELEPHVREEVSALQDLLALVAGSP